MPIRGERSSSYRRLSNSFLMSFLPYSRREGRQILYRMRSQTSRRDYALEAFQGILSSAWTPCATPSGHQRRSNRIEPMNRQRLVLRIDADGFNSGLVKPRFKRFCNLFRIPVPAIEDYYCTFWSWFFPGTLIHQFHSSKK